MNPREGEKMSTVNAVTAEQLLERAIAMQPVLRERANHARELRRVPDETISDFKQAGFFRMIQPCRYGGYEMNPKHFYDVVFELARACPSSAWVLSVVAVHNHRKDLGRTVQVRHHGAVLPTQWPQ